MIEYLFLDLDDTILDFGKAERDGICATFRELGLMPTEEVLARYHVINQAHWQMLERGELTREQVVVQRFAALFAELDCPADPVRCARCYEENLSRGHDFLPGAREAVVRLSQKYRLFLASNGTATVQHRRMTEAGLYPYFEKVFVSQHIGANKPEKAYFERSFAQIPGFDATKAMIVGDSLTSDILGGLNAGILTCWVNPEGKHAPETIRPHYTIPDITHLETLLESLE